jgi:hypothetical protein
VPDNVRDTFDQIRQFVKWDLRAIFEADHGGNYAAALLIAVGCEALSRLMDRPTAFYLTEILTKRGLRRELAEDVAEALRNGIAHIYDTLYLQAGPLRLELIVSWGAMPHLTLRKEPPGLHLNVRTMADDLRGVFEELREALPVGGALPRRWVDDSVHGIDGRHIPLWRDWFEAAEKIGT